MIIKEFKKKYFIGEDGNVYKQLAHHRTSNGYRDFKDADAIHHRIHRLVATAFIPNPSNYSTVDHIDGDRENNDISNLRWTTQSDNLLAGYERRKDTPVRNFVISDLYKDELFVKRFGSVKEASEYAESIDGAKASMLRKYKKNKGWEIRCIDYPVGE